MFYMYLLETRIRLYLCYDFRCVFISSSDANCIHFIVQNDANVLFKRIHYNQFIECVNE